MNSCILSEKYIVDKQYKIEDEKIIPIDAENTGVLQKNTQLSNGLHQFLQLKEGLKLTPISYVTNFISNMGFYFRYITSKCNSTSNGQFINIGEKEEEINIYGLTGTIGGESTMKILDNVYGFDFRKVPRFKTLRRIELVGRINQSVEENYESLTEIITRELNQKRAVLLICEYIAIVDRSRYFNQSYWFGW